MVRAWMLRNDGKLIPMKFAHIYGNEEAFRLGYDIDYLDLQETAEAAAWLYDNTQHDKTRDICVRFIVMWIDVASMVMDKDMRVKAFKDMITHDDIPDSEILTNFVLSNESLLTKPELSNVDNEGSLIELGRLVCAELNQEFIRVRMGGMYDSSVGNSELYFRIASVGFNWFNIIWKVVHGLKPTYVTVCRDFETTGSDGYLKVGSLILNKVPYNEFITLPGNPVLEHIKRYPIDELAKGKSIIEAYEKKNINRVLRFYSRAIVEESKLLYSGHYLKKLSKLVSKGK